MVLLLFVALAGLLLMNRRNALIFAGLLIAGGVYRAFLFDHSQVHSAILGGLIVIGVGFFIYGIADGVALWADRVREWLRQ